MRLTFQNVLAEQGRASTRRTFKFSPWDRRPVLSFSSSLAPLDRLAGAQFCFRLSRRAGKWCMCTHQTRSQFSSMPEPTGPYEPPDTASPQDGRFASCSRHPPLRSRLPRRVAAAAAAEGIGRSRKHGRKTNANPVVVIRDVTAGVTLEKIEARSS
jgi:hypothetical protein